MRGLCWGARRRLAVHIGARSCHCFHWQFPSTAGIDQPPLDQLLTHGANKHPRDYRISDLATTDPATIAHRDYRPTSTRNIGAAIIAPSPQDAAELHTPRGVRGVSFSAGNSANCLCCGSFHRRPRSPATTPAPGCRCSAQRKHRALHRLAVSAAFILDDVPVSDAHCRPQSPIAAHFGV